MKPAWLRARLPAGTSWARLEGILERHSLETVCDSARCPNKGECWGAGAMAFLIMGPTCTRACRFCAVPTAGRGAALDPEEPERLAEAAAELGLGRVLVTSVDRDDLADRGSGPFAACIAAIARRLPGAETEALIPDYRGPELERILSASPAVISHNVETVERLQGLRDRRASYKASLACLELAARGGAGVVKSSLLLGLGETRAEVLGALRDLRGAGCTSVVLGQYLRPGPSQVPVAEYLPPEEFARYAEEARGMGFQRILSAPLARTSYHALDGAPRLPA